MGDCLVKKQCVMCDPLLEKQLVKNEVCRYLWVP